MLAAEGSLGADLGGEMLDGDRSALRRGYEQQAGAPRRAAGDQRTMLQGLREDGQCWVTAGPEGQQRVEHIKIKVDSGLRPGQIGRASCRERVSSPV